MMCGNCGCPEKRWVVCDRVYHKDNRDATCDSGDHCGYFTCTSQRSGWLAIGDVHAPKVSVSHQNGGPPKNKGTPYPDGSLHLNLMRGAFSCRCSKVPEAWRKGSYPSHLRPWRTLWDLQVWFSGGGTAWNHSCCAFFQFQHQRDLYLQKWV